MIRPLIVRFFRDGALTLSVLLAMMFFLPPRASGRPALPGPELSTVLGCRIVQVTGAGARRMFRPLVDVSLDPAVGTAGDEAFEAFMPGGRKIGAKVKRVRTALPGSRYNATLFVDGQTHLRVNHMDLDIYIETTIDEAVFILHCFPEASVSEGAPTAP
jgi:hypothetical protein